MIDVINLFLRSDLSKIYISATPIYVCSKRKFKTIDKKGNPLNTYYYIKKCNSNVEERVSRCTWLANEVGQLFLYEENKKWCNKEKSNYKSVWMYS